MRGFWLTCGLALRDWAYERLLSACAVLALASMLVPLLVLSGVRYGVISALRERLLQDPAILAVTPVGSGAYTPQWLGTITARPEVRFGILRTRDIAATMQLMREAPATPGGVATPRFVRVSLEPTGPGDPLLDRAGVRPQEGDTLILSEPAARKLDVRAGDAVKGQLGRKRPDGGLESATLELKVGAVLPLEAEDRDVAFVPLGLLEDAENYRDYIAVPRRGFAGDPAAGERKYAGFRLYAANLEDVAVLRDLLEQQGIETYTRAREVGFVTGLDTSLTIIFALIAVTAGAGFAASTASSVLAAVRRKDKQLGVMRLIGLPGGAIMAYPVIQALLTGLLGTLLAGLAYLGLSYGIDRLFSDQLYGAQVCRLPAAHFVLIAIVVLLLCGLASVRAAVRAARIEPSEVLRDL